MSATEKPKPPPAALDYFAWLFRGRVSSLRGMAAVGAAGASFFGAWPLVLYWCRTRGKSYAASVFTSLLLWPVMLWALLLHGFNTPVELVPYDPNREPWHKRRPFPKPGSHEWGKLNRERARLIRKKVRREPMTEGERLRYQWLMNETKKALSGG